jgi:DNA helicase II / ATP-dependent DNA helicase PcrA
MAVAAQTWDAMTVAQREAVLADERVLAVVAGAGAGKTGVLTARVARRCLDGTAAAGHTLVCTFSRKAAEELRTRLWRVGVSGVRAGTVHRLALRVVAEWREHRSDPPPVVLGDRRRVLEAILAANPVRPLTAALLDTEIGWAKARLVSPDGYEAEVGAARRALRAPASQVAERYAAYEDQRRRRSLLDLNDLLLEAAAAIEDDDGFGTAVRWRHRHVLVDEVQDLSAAQFRLLRALGGQDPDLFVVGDPSQSIYGWSGADPSLIDDLGRHFPDIRVIRLEENHRCAPAIVRLATAALGRGGGPLRSTRPEGPLPVLCGHSDGEAEARWVAREAWLAHRPGRRWSHIAVLARTNAQLDTVARILRDQRIPVEQAGDDRGPASDLGPNTEDGTLESEADDESPDAGPADGVVLSTFHRAKGLQWPCVFVIGINEGLVPIASARASESLDEERRLLYVAMTRAEDQLWCSWAGEARPSRWWTEVEEARAELDREQAPAPPAVAAAHLARLRALVAGGPL